MDQSHIAHPITAHMHSDDISLIGGKGRSLAILQHCGLLVPKAVIFPTSLCDDYYAQGKSSPIILI